MAGKSRKFLLALTIALTVVATTELNTGSQAQTSPLPSGPLMLGAFTAEFRADGTFVAEASIEGMGTLRTTAQWTAERDVVEFSAWNNFKGVGFLGPDALTGCEVPGRYRYAVEGASIRFARVADNCEARRMLLDGTRWRPAGTPEKFSERRIVVELAKPTPALTKAADASGSWPSFRGPEASGVADGQQLPDRWNGETGEHILWRTPIGGLAHSSPIVWGDRLFVTSAISDRGDATLKPGQYSDGDPSNDRSRYRWMLSRARPSSVWPCPIPMAPSALA